MKNTDNWRRKEILPEKNAVKPAYLALDGTTMKDICKRFFSEIILFSNVTSSLFSLYLIQNVFTSLARTWRYANFLLLLQAAFGNNP